MPRPHDWDRRGHPRRWRWLGMDAVGAVHGKVVFSRRVDVLASLIARLVPTGRVIDVGCGDGSIAHRVGELRPDVTLEGFDVLVRKATDIPVREFDGLHLPLGNDSAAACLLVDVLHHAEDPLGLLEECARVAPVIVVKDHLAHTRLEWRILAVMDWVGNRPHGVVLPYHYYSPGSWDATVAHACLREAVRDRPGRLYPLPFSLVFGGRLHFVSRLERKRPVGAAQSRLT
jgi:SAM-dependent methyltransferase